MTRSRVFRPSSYVFFALLLGWIAAKVAYSFTDEFPRLSLLCKWDCGWYESIARQGYLSPIPPLFQDSERSNVAFFPAYPLLGRTIAAIFAIPLVYALPLGSILCSVILSIALARLFSAESRLSRGIRYAVLLAYPAAFYLFVSYSEALYLSAMLGGASLVLDPGKKRPGLGLALVATAGVVLGGTRLTGFVVPAFLFLAAGLFAARTATLDIVRDGTVRRAAIFLGTAGAGSAAFFAFCHWKFGVWNLYFKQLAIGWYKEFSPVKAYRLLVDHPFGPTFDSAVLLAESRRLSWMLIATILVVSIYASTRAALSARDAFRAGDRPLFLRCFLVFAAFAHFFIVVCGDVGPWDAWGNGLRYPMPTVFLLAVAWRDEWTPAFVRGSRGAKFVALATLTVVLVWLFSLEVGYLERFIKNEWVS